MAGSARIGCILGALWIVALSGCAGSSRQAAPAAPLAASPLPPPASPSQVVLCSMTAEPPAPASPADGDDPFRGQTELSLAVLLTEVQARNPSLQAAAAAWRAATQRYPQAVALEDPM
ncbi:MAG: hypothetical protein ABSG68_25900, partial [Thermoguttaceae bacterium]